MHFFYILEFFLITNGRQVNKKFLKGKFYPHTVFFSFLNSLYLHFHTITDLNMLDMLKLLI